MKERTDNSILLSIVIPIFNEENNIDELYYRLVSSISSITNNYEMIFVNDGSKDNSLIKIIELNKKDNRVKYIGFSRNFGHQIAVTAGMDCAKGEAVVIIDADLQDPPEIIPTLYKKFNEGFDVVYAQRKSRKGETWLKKITARCFYRIMNKITTVDIPLDTGDFRIVSKKVVQLLRQMPEKNKFIRGQISWLGFKQTGVLFDRQERKRGKTGYSYAKMIRFALDGITSFSDKPLKLVANLGFFFAFISFGIIIYAVYSHFVLERTISGWTSLIISTMFIGGIQLISIGVIGEYISRINHNTQNRPLYIIDKSNINID
jgi:dolichol-phosphate mannosyltransferase